MSSPPRRQGPRRVREPLAPQIASESEHAQAARFARPLLAWFRRHGRRDLPWQRRRNLYRVWISEIMLQQTQVATVIPYYERFMTRFPAVASLAGAPLDEVLHHWSGLGYYARARNLHRAAQHVHAAYGGELPSDLEELRSLPGIGRSTAGAILALALDERQPILDGNVRRVLARWFGVGGASGTAAVDTRLWALSEAVTPPRAAAAFTQAIMDLGATLCTRHRPRCADCPVATDCVARATDRTDLLPTARPGRARPEREVVWLVLRRAHELLLAQRPPSGVWGGLWGFPEYPTVVAATAAARTRGVGASAKPQRLAPIRHEFTHFTLTVTPLLLELCHDAAAVMEGAGETWYNSRQPPKLGLAAPVSALVETLVGSGSEPRRRRTVSREK